MTPPRAFRSGVMAMIFFGLTSSWSMPCRAESGGDGDFTALQAEAQKSFKDRVTPFVKNYCMDCHGKKKRKAGVSFNSVFKNPGDAAFSKQWKQSLTNVKTHDMPPDDADKQPTDEERQMFMDWIGKVKYLSAKDPGPFVIRRLTRVEYGNTLHDLYGVDPAVARDLPDEVFGEGYLNSLSARADSSASGMVAHNKYDRRDAS